MAEGKSVINVRAPIDKVWDFVSSMERVGSCVPGVQAIQIIDDRTADWTVQLKLGPISQTVKVRTESVEMVPPSHGAFLGRGELMDVHGTIDLRPLGAAETEITYVMKVEAKGSLGRIIDNFMKARLAKETQQFAENLRGKLQA